MNSKNRRFGWLRIYSAMFALAALGLLACFLVQNKHLVGELDGVHQHYTTLAFIQQIIRDLLAGRGFDMLSLQLGQGLDTIGTLSYYGLADPLNWIAALFPANALEYAYALIIFVRLYLLGLSFGWYVRTIGLRDDWSAGVSAFVYTFCGFFLKATLRHPYFADGGLYLALMLIGVERLLARRKWLMFTLCAALMLAANYYFGFQTTLLVIAYIILRLCFRFRRRGLRGTAADGFALMGAYILGALLCAVYFLPVVLNFLGNARIDDVGSYAASLLHYGPEYYLKLILYFCAPYMTTGAWMHENFVPVAVFGVIMLFVSTRKGDPLRRQLRWAFGIVLAFACIPMAGKIFNGLGYVSNRWCYGFAFAVCAALAWALPELMDRDCRRLRPVAWISLGFALVMLAGSLFTELMIMLAGAAALIAFAVFLLIYDQYPRITRQTAMRLLALATVGCCMVYQAMIYLPLGGSFAEDYGEGRFADKLAGETAAAVSAIADDGNFGRVDVGAWDDCHQNIHDYSGTSMYWSVVPNHVFAHYRDLELGSQYSAYRICGMNGSTALNALASVRHALRDRNNAEVLPYGYGHVGEVVQSDGDTVDIYENQYALPIGYVFDETMSVGQYQALDPVSKQAALMRCAVLEDGDDAAFASPVTDCRWQLTTADGAELSENRVVAEKGGSLSFELASLPDSETYLLWEGLRCAGPMDTDGITLRIESDAGRSIGRISDPSSNYHFNQKGICVNLGYGADGITRCVVNFTAAGEFLFDSLRFVSLPMDAYRSAVETLRRNAMTDIKLESDALSGTVNLDRPGVLQISLPYSSGWTASVNGEPAEIRLCGGMYMGVELPAGAHSVALCYVTPGLKTGACISAAALALIIALCILGRVRRKKELSA